MPSENNQFISQQAKKIREKIEAYQDPEITSDLGDEEALRFSSLINKKLPLLLTALQRIESGIYESCRVCQRPIEQNRLKAVPEADTCMECSRKPYNPIKG